MHRIQSGAKSHAFDRNLSTNAVPTQASTTRTSTFPPLSQPYKGHAVPGTTPTKAPDEKHNVDLNHTSTSSSNEAPDVRSSALPPPAPPPLDTKDEGSQSPTITSTKKPSWPKRARAGSKRFAQHTKDAVTHSWINVLLLFVPIGIAIAYAPIDPETKPTIVFALNAVAIIPLAGLLSHATESVASRMGDTLAALLNVTFGNAVELIIFILALSKNQIQIVQASILGSILANLLLILGMAFLAGGLRYREQLYNSTVTQMSAVVLALAVTSLLIPTAFHASFSNYTTADYKTVKISRGTCVVLLLVYILYLLFQLKSHAYMYESTPQNIIDEESHPGLLAGMMDSSSSDSSSSSSSDSDSSTGSHITATKRIKRALKHRKRRKSNASSTIASSSAAISSPSSPSPESNSILDHGRSYFHRHRRDTNNTNASTVLSGDEADMDGEQGRPRVRDFQDEKDGVSNGRSSILKDSKKYKKHQKHSKKSKKSKIADEEQAQPISESPAEINEDFAPRYTEKGPSDSPHVGFAPGVDQPAEMQAPTSNSRRPFAITRQSFRPPMPSVFTNTVFSTPPPPAQSTTTTTAALSIVGTHGPQLRRTNSLPDRLNRQASRQSAAARKDTPITRYPGTQVMNQADAIAKDREEDNKPPVMSKTAAVMLLLCSTGLVAFCAELLVDAIPEMIGNTGVSEAFIGLIVLPIVGNAAEHVTAVAVAAKNKMDLAIGIAIGSSIQIALFITPVVVLLGWILNKDMSLLFTLFETISLFVTVLIVNFLVLDGRSNYLEGTLLIAAYVIIALAAFFYPSVQDSSVVGGGDNPTQQAVLRMFF